MKAPSLKSERQQRGWSQTKLAKALGVSTTTVRRWEQGQAMPYPYYRNKLAALFGKTADELGLLPQGDEQEETALIALQSETAPQACLLTDPAKPEALDNARSLLEPDALPQPGKDLLRPRSLWDSHLGSLNRVLRFRPPNRAWHPFILLSILLVAVLLIVVVLLAFHWRLSPRTSQAPNHNGTCALAWGGQEANGGGSTDLDVSQVRDLGLRHTLQSKHTKGRRAQPAGYHLFCESSRNLQFCSLVQSTSNQGTNGNPNLDLDNSIISPYVHDKLLNKYSLQCNNNGKSSRSKSPINVATSGPVTISALVTSTPPSSYEAESSQNTLSGGAHVMSCSGCSGGYRVGYIGLQSNGTSGTLQFNNIKKNIAGSYMMTIHYTEGDAGGRTGYISVNGRPALSFTGDDTGSFKRVETVDIVVSLDPGNNSIKFSNPDDKAPDIDNIVV